jgi:hypothetical protein
MLQADSQKIKYRGMILMYRKHILVTQVIVIVMISFE